ncbi:MAG: ATP-binding cassette domain-containing protein [Pseudohongiellaceae bacterium]
MNAIVTVEQALCRVNRHCLLEVERFVLAAGEHWTVLGGNGAGKSTLGRLLAGLRRESASYVCYADGFDPRRDVCQVSFEEQQHLWQYDAQHDISEFNASAADRGTVVEQCVRSRRSPAEQDEQFFASLSDALKLHELSGKGIRYLSSGELRRVMLARALYSQLPGQVKLLIFDDPLESLDRQSREPIANSIEQFLLPDTISLRLMRRVSDILPGSTHLAFMQAGGKHQSQGSGKRKGQGGEEHEERGSEERKRQGNEERLRIVAEGDFAAMLDSKLVTQFRQRRAKVPRWPDELASAPTQPNQNQQTPTPLIELREVSASYGEHLVLDKLNWRVNPGDHVLIEGPNGCGKSTLLSLIDGENHKGYGQELYLFGQRKGSGESVWEVKARFGLVSNELHNRYLKGWQVLEVVLSGFYDSVGLYDNSSAAEATQAGHWLSLIGLDHKARHHYHELSFGEQRLTLLARAMVKQPRILVLDEPCVGLDDYHRRLILNLLDLITAHCNTQLIYVSHTQGEHPNCINRRMTFRPETSPAPTISQTRMK